ncbi:MAG: glycosyltransferase [Candidatus Daviesbacteria bacterium]|nr:glycosyltransferase [Candidatus Daviesbacteria bacterium]
MNRPKLVSVVITTKNEQDVIEKLLKSTKNQSYKRLEVILVDNNSSDRTLEIAKKMHVKFYTYGPERSAQRNLGANKARGEYLLFLDADMELTSNVIKECIRIAKSDKKIGAVIIPETSKAHNFWEKVKGFERSFYNEKGDPITDAARFFSKKAFISAGGYDETITGPEDWDLPETIRELGFKIVKISSRIIHKERISSPFSLAKKKFYYGLRAYRYLSKHKIPLIGPKTIYFLRPVFLKNINKIIKHPILSFGMVMMLSAELIGGGMGYLVGRIRKL